MFATADEDFLKVIALLMPIYILFASPASAKLGPHTLDLIRTDDVKINREECQKVEDQLGQIFYVNVDSFQTIGHSVNPEYVRMVKDLNIGGVLPKFGLNTDLKMVRKATEALQSATELPLFISVDRDQLSIEPGEFAPFGLGWGVGELGSIDRYEPKCQKRIAELQAIMHRVAGLNQALGPTIEKKGTNFLNQPAGEVYPTAKLFFDSFDEIGVATTMKHFPYTPDSYNLHDKTEDTKIPKEKVLEMLEIFKKSVGNVQFAMTTHLLNSNIDPAHMATFSKTWIDLLRNEVGYKGLLMTDGLFMIENYDTIKRQVTNGWAKQGKRKITNKHAIFTMRAIMSGHDMVILEGTSAQTRKVFKDVHYTACQNSQLAKELRENIFRSYQRVKAFKEANYSLLRPNIPVPDQVAHEGIRLISEYSKSSNNYDQCLFNRTMLKMQNISKGGPSFKIEPENQNKTPEVPPCRLKEPEVCSNDTRYKNFMSQIKAIGFISYSTQIKPAKSVDQSK